MKSQDILLCCTSSMVILPLTAAESHAAPSKPNIVWYVTEDLSPQFLALFNEGRGCRMPNVERLAERGMVYPNAYSNAPVSSAARTTLITSCYAPSFEGSFHRYIELNALPEGLKMFPAYLREAGYYTFNSVKQDYNVELSEDAWDDISSSKYGWRDREDKSRPFFLERTVQTTHESKVLFTEEVYRSVETRHDLDSVFLLPHVPDTHLMRYTYATIYDRLEESDTEFGELVDVLEAEGELDNTIIFFFGDNGGTTAGTKGYTDNVGVQVPLVVYVPQRWQEELKAEAGVVREDLVSFIDFGATALSIAGVEIPERVDGTPFLGREASRGVESVVCYGDRFDELYSFNRSIRKGDFRYERNYQPYQRQSLFALYRYKQMAFREWRELNQEGKLNAAQSRFFEPQGVEELYNLREDPHELNNLALDPAYRERLDDLRCDLNDYLLEKCDLGFFPESIIHEEAMANPASYGEQNRDRIAQFMMIADLQRLTYRKAKKELVKALNSSDPVEVWWALTTAAYFGAQAQELSPMAQSLLVDSRSFVASRAMLFLSICGERFSSEQLKGLFASTRKDAETLRVLGDFAIMVEAGLGDPFPLTIDEVQAENFSIEWRIRYLQSLYDSTPISEICDNDFGK